MQRSRCSLGFGDIDTVLESLPINNISLLYTNCNIHMSGEIAVDPASEVAGCEVYKPKLEH